MAKSGYNRPPGFWTGHAWAAPLAAALTLALLVPVQSSVRPPMLLAERFVAGGGWPVIAVLATYAALVTRGMLDPARQPRWRRRIWWLFSAVFFAQLLLGLLGFERFLMSGDLHLPVPALVAAGPIYEGGGLFMPILFGITVLLVGPAWCSHLCYIGAWDQRAADSRRRPRPLPGWTRALRPALLAAVIGAALLLRVLGAPGLTATLLAAAFGILGVILMISWSRRRGVMAHCVAYCPLGWLAMVLGKLSPFRLRITPECTDCGRCTLACRYDALSEADILRRRPGLTCTLCGDCVGQCRDDFIHYRLPGLRGPRARAAFIALVTAVQATFLGVARL